MGITGNSSKVDQRAQPSGVPSHGEHRGGVGPSDGPDRIALDLHARLCELVPDVDLRIKFLRVPAAVDAAWTEARMLPVLRAQAKRIRAEITRLEHVATND